MSAHELARKLLDGPDYPVVISDPHDDLAGNGTVLDVRVGKYRVDDGKCPIQDGERHGDPAHVAWVNSLEVVDCIRI